MKELRRYGGLLACAVMASVSVACSGESSAAGQPSSAKPQTVTVLAAASLTEPLTELARAFEQAHPGVTVHTSFGSSTTLAQQVAAGAPADLVAFAGTAAVKELPEKYQDAKLATVIARNTLEIATPPDNPGAVQSVGDLARKDVQVVLCVATAPCGKAADALMTAASVTPHVVSREVDVKATLAKVRLGEADAAVVYHSDVVSAGDAVHGVEIPDAQNQVLAYPEVRLNDRDVTAQLADFIASDTGRKALVLHGFLAP